MNTLVIVIISLVVLAGGITLLYKFIGGATETQKNLDQRTQQELERLLLEEGKRVALPSHVAYVQRGESHIFGIGILNIGGDIGDKFTIEVELARATAEQKGQIPPGNILNEWLLYVQDPIVIKEGDYHTEPISVDAPETAMKGEYIFKARVSTESGMRYGNPQQFIVNVK